MIVLIGLRTDPVLRYIFQQLSHFDLYLVFIDQQRLGRSLWIDEHGIVCHKNQWRIEHKQVLGVINRMVATPNCTKNCPEHLLQLEWLSHLLDAEYPHVLNKPTPGLSNSSKPYQLSHLPCNHLQVPSSIITTNMLPPQQDRMIFKSISSVRSIVQPLTSSLQAKKTYEPVVFQRRCCGQNIRVHTVNDRLIATAINSDTLDYRYSDNHNQIHEIKLPTEIAADCLALANYLDLPFSGIDLINEQQKWLVLEVNPAPGYNYFEQHLPDNPISLALANFFSNIHETSPQ